MDMHPGHGAREENSCELTRIVKRCKFHTVIGRHEMGKNE